MTRPLLSVVMPVHNGERWIAAALDSLCRQDGRDFECLVIDSSQTDASLEIVQRYSDRLDLRIDRRPDVLSWTDKTNLGASEAKGRFLCMLHQDDLWMPDRLAHVRRWIDHHPSATMLLHPVDIIDEYARRLGTWRCPLPPTDAATSRDLLLSRLIVQNFIAIPSPVIGRDAFLAVGGLDRDLWYTADWDLYLKLATFGDVYYHSEILASFRVHSTSQTITGSRSADDLHDQMQRVLDRHSPRISGSDRAGVLRTARASIHVNVALARAGNGRPSALGLAVMATLALGPFGAYRYVRDSRIIERLAPRVRARLAGAL